MNELTGDYLLTQDQINFFDENGFVFLPSVLTSDEVVYYRDVIDKVVEEKTKKDPRKLHERNAYEREFLQCGHLWWNNPVIKKLTLSKRLGNTARQLLKAEKVRLWHDQALYKLPGGDATRPHQDVSYWPMRERKAGTIWIALDDVTAEMGAMSFIPGSHQAGIDGYNYTIEDSINNRSDIINESLRKTKKQPVSFNLKPGGATFHHGLTVHFTGPNNSAKTRKGMTIIYFSDGVTYDGKSPAKDHFCAAGTADKEPIATERTPLII